MNAQFNNEFVRTVNNGAKWKSTTHEERYYHIGHEGTVFFRQENDGKWYASTVIRDARDNFTRRGGRTQSRRKYFSQPSKRVQVERPSYDTACKLVDDAWERRHTYRFMNSFLGKRFRDTVSL